MSLGGSVVKATSGFGAISKEGQAMAKAHFDDIGKGAGKDWSGSNRRKLMGNWIAGNVQEAAHQAGHTSVLGLAGSHAVRGAAWGAVAGGTIEAVQGGSFWDGAKQGAFNGAVGWTGYRMGMHAVGSTRSGLNVVGGVKDIYKGGTGMWRATGGGDVQVSKQAEAILSQRQRDGLARGMMNMYNKASSAK